MESEGGGKKAQEASEDRTCKLLFDDPCSTIDFYVYVRAEQIGATIILVIDTVVVALVILCESIQEHNSTLGL